MSDAVVFCKQRLNQLDDDDDHIVVCRQIWQNFINMRSHYNNTLAMTALAEFLAEQDNWTRSMIDNHPSDMDAYWRHVAYILAQFDGLHAGYKAAALPDWVK